MSEVYVCNTKLDNPLRFRLSRIKKISQHITALNYAEKSLLVLSGASSGVSLFSFTNAISTTVRIASAGINFLFPITKGIFKMFLKTWETEKQTQKDCYISQKLIEYHTKI